MKILVLVEDLRINTTSSGVGSSNIIASLLAAGHSVSCIYDYAETSSFPWLQGDVSFSRVAQTAPNAFWLFLKKYTKGDAISILLRGYPVEAAHKVRMWKEQLSKTLKESEGLFDFIFVLGAGTSFLPYFAISKMNVPYKWIVNYHDPYPIVYYPEPYKREGRRIIDKIQIRNSHRVIRKAYRVSFPSQRLYEWMSHFEVCLKQKSLILPHPNANLQHLPACVDDDSAQIDSRYFNLLHTGTLLGPRNPSSLLCAFELFISNSPEKREKTLLHFVGGDKTMTNYASYACRHNVRVFSRRVSYARSRELMQQSSVLLIIEADAEESPFMPGKLSDYIVAGKPIMALSPKKSEVRRLLGDDYPYATENGNVQQMVQILNILWDKWIKDPSIPPQYRRDELLTYISGAYYCTQLEKAIR